VTAVRPSPRPDRPRGNAIQRLYRGQTNYDFINRWKIWFACSGAVIVVGLCALAIGGLNFSIDFKGGSLWQVPTKASVATVRADMGKISPLLTQDITQLSNQQTGQVNIQVEAPASLTSDTALVTRVTTELAAIGHVPVRDVTAELIGPSWGSSISKKAIEAVIVFLVLIAIAISLYFEPKMAAAGLIALLHDILITVGIYALSGFQVSPDTVIAFLTVMGYSLYDTIVVFDKVKENTKGLASTNKYTYTDVVNLSMNQVMARSVNTSFVAIMPVFCILVIGSWILGASALNDFGLALFIGLMSGAYSSIFIASPILALLKEREPRYVEIRRRLAAYPQSRQILTANMVADGTLVVPRAQSASAGALVGRAGSASSGPASIGAGSSGGGPRPAAWSGRSNRDDLPWKLQQGGPGNGGARPGAGNGEDARHGVGEQALAGDAAAGGPPGSAPTGDGFESYAGRPRSRAANGGRPGRRAPAAGNGGPAEPTRASSTGADAAPSTGAAAPSPAEDDAEATGTAGVAARRVPPRPAGPRPRKKQPPRRR
jgi:preprotein translocase subunit SecF